MLQIKCEFGVFCSCLWLEILPWTFEILNQLLGLEKGGPDMRSWFSLLSKDEEYPKFHFLFLFFFPDLAVPPGFGDGRDQPSFFSPKFCWNWGFLSKGGVSQKLPKPGFLLFPLFPPWFGVGVVFAARQGTRLGVPLLSFTLEGK